MPTNINKVLNPVEVELISRGFADTAPDPQVSTNSEAVLDGSELDTGGYGSLSYTIRVATKSIDWVVYGADAADYSDKVEVKAAATVAASAVGSYAVAPPPYRYYRVTIASTVPGDHGTATVVAHCKT